MEHCQHHSLKSNLIESFFYPIIGIEKFDILIAFFLLGVSNSFTHCIGMCGPIALGQVTMRLINMSSEGANQIRKLQAGIAFWYYFGKALTYSMIASSIVFVSRLFFADVDFLQSSLWHCLRFVILISLSFIFVYFAIRRILFLDEASSFYTCSMKKVHSYDIDGKACGLQNMRNATSDKVKEDVGTRSRSCGIIHFLKSLYIKMNIGFLRYMVGKIGRLKGFLMNLSLGLHKRILHKRPNQLHYLLFGLLLGFIPCGLVYAVIITAISIEQDVLFVFVAVMIFGLGTFPGLFLVSYFGTAFLKRYKNVFNFIYIFAMLTNSIIVLTYLFK